MLKFLLIKYILTEHIGTENLLSILTTTPEAQESRSTRILLGLSSRGRHRWYDLSNVCGYDMMYELCSRVMALDEVISNVVLSRNDEKEVSADCRSDYDRCITTQLCFAFYLAQRAQSLAEKTQHYLVLVLRQLFLLSCLFGFICTCQRRTSHSPFSYKI
jgi:hypothetical protein